MPSAARSAAAWKYRRATSVVSETVGAAIALRAYRALGMSCDLVINIVPARAAAIPQARARAGRAGAAGDLAAAPAAPLARGPPLQRLGARRRRRDRPRGHRHAPAWVARAPRAGDADGQPEDRARPAARGHPRPRRPLRPGGADRRALGRRGVDEPQPRPRTRLRRGPRRHDGAPDRGRPPERRARGAAARLRRGPQG